MKSKTFSIEGEVMICNSRCECGVLGVGFPNDFSDKQRANPHIKILKANIKIKTKRKFSYEQS